MDIYQEQQSVGKFTRSKALTNDLLQKVRSNPEFPCLFRGKRPLSHFSLSPSHYYYYHVRANQKEKKIDSLFFFLLLRYQPFFISLQTLPPLPASRRRFGRHSHRLRKIKLFLSTRQELSVGPICFICFTKGVTFSLTLFLPLPR